MDKNANTSDEMFKIPNSTTHHQAVYADIIESSGVPIVVTDDDGNYIFVNQGAVDLFGYSTLEFEHMSVRDIKVPDGFKTAIHYKNYVKLGSGVGEFQFFSKNGDRKIALYQAFRVRKDFNVSIMIDISDLD